MPDTSHKQQPTFTTGEFADLFDTTKHTLFHYDDIGIFSPEIKKDNGYRYYTARQLEVFRVIEILKELDMPLSEIKEYLKRRSPQELLSLLSREEEVINKKIRELKEMRELVRRKSAMIASTLKLTPDIVYEETAEDEYMIATPACRWEDEKKMAYMLSEHVRFCESKGAIGAYAIGEALEKEAVASEEYWDYKIFYTRVDKPFKLSELHIKPAGRYIAILHRGGYDTTGLSYTKLISYMSEHGLVSEGLFYEDTLLDELSVNGFDEYQIKISVKVCRCP